MGWYCLDKPKGMTVRAFMEKEFPSVEILDMVAGLHVAYAAERIPAQPELGVFAVVYLLNHHGDGYFNFCYKDMDETCGPVERQCPERILKLLPPLPEMSLEEAEEKRDYRYQWRADCWANVERKKRLEAQPSPQHGDTIVLRGELRFTDGTTQNRFKVVKQGRKTIFRGENYRTYNITAWRDREFVVLVPGQEGALA